MVNDIIALKEIIKDKFLGVRNTSPLVHCITNYVTVNDCANVILSCGASPVMSDEIKDCVDITSISNALVINIGTLTRRTVKSMKASCRAANKIGIPIVLDPVGAGATKYRTKVALELLKKFKISVLRGNVSEIKTIFGDGGKTKGVDASDSDKITIDNLDNVINMAKSLALRLGLIVSISGQKDIITDGKTTYLVLNGNSKMGNITGTGCQSTALIASFLGPEKTDDTQALEATLSAVALMGVAGDVAIEKHPDCGNSSYRSYIIDEICNMSAQDLSQRAKVEIYS